MTSTQCRLCIGCKYALTESESDPCFKCLDNPGAKYWEPKPPVEKVESQTLKTGVLKSE